MCGRFHFDVLPDTKIGKQINEISKKLNLVYTTGEIFPSNDVLCIIPKESKIDLSVKKWGIQNKTLQINAKLETINDKPTYDAFKHNRCAVLCNGFYEWDKDKQKYYIDFEESYMYLACIFNENNELLIVTTSSNDEFSKIHERMPIVMNKQEMLNYVHNKDDIFTSKNFKIRNVDMQTKLL